MSARPRPIAIAVVEHEGRFLIGRRPAGAPLAGLWEFPGGKLHSGERPAEAAVRECREETGLAVEVQGELLVHVEQYEHGAVELHFLACRLASDAAEPHPPFRWVNRTELSHYQFPSGNNPLLNLLRAQGFQHTDN